MTDRSFRTTLKEDPIRKVWAVAVGKVGVGDLTTLTVIGPTFGQNGLYVNTGVKQQEESMSGEIVIQNIFANPHLGETVPFQEFIEPGRKNVEFFPLYTTEQTGPEGPTAMLLHYLPGATNQRHIHPSYELIVVLDGELVDDNGHYGPGTLLVSPPGSSHAASSPKGCTILILWEKPVQRILQESQEASASASL